MASEENEELLLNEEVVTEPTYTSLCLSSSDSQVASSSSNTHGLGSRRRVADPSKASQKIHVTILVCQILCLAFLGTVSAMYLVNHSISRGQCLMTAQYFPGGALNYQKDDIVWCDIAAYVCMIGSTALLTMITVNWLAGIRTAIKCIKAELGASAIVFAITAVGCGLLWWKFKIWCQNLTMSVSCEEDGKRCANIVSGAFSCKDAATTFDAKNFSKYDHMTPTYDSTVKQMVFLSFSSLMWFFLVLLLAFLLGKARRDWELSGPYRLSSMKYPKRQDLGSAPEHLYVTPPPPINNTSNGDLSAQ